jgi:hypothetical protein
MKRQTPNSRHSKMRWFVGLIEPTSGPPLVAPQESQAGSRRDVGSRHRATNLGFALVRWTHPRGLPPSSATLSGSGAGGWIYSGQLSTLMSGRFRSRHVTGSMLYEHENRA